MDASARHRLLLLSGVPLPAMRVPAAVEDRATGTWSRHPHAGQKYRHGWRPALLALLLPEDVDDEYGPELDAVEFGEAARIVAREQAVTVEEPRGDEVAIHAAPTPDEALRCADAIEQGEDLHMPDYAVTHHDGVTSVSFGGLDEDFDPAGAATLAQNLRDMAYVSEDAADVPDEPDVDEPDDETPIPDRRSAAAMERHRLLQLAGVELRAAKSNPAPGRQVVTREGVEKYGLPLGATILPGMRALTAAQRAKFLALPEPDRSRYLAVRRRGAPHGEAMKVAPPVSVQAPSKKAAPVRALPPAYVVRRQLLDAGSPDAARVYLDSLNLSQAEARKLAKELGVGGSRKNRHGGADRADVEGAKNAILGYFADFWIASDQLAAPPPPSALADGIEARPAPVKAAKKAAPRKAAAPDATMTPTRVRQLVDETPVSVEELPGGAMAESVQLRTYASGERIVVKTTRGLFSPEAAVRQADAEELGALVIDAVGGGVQSAGVVRIDPRTVAMRYIDAPIGRSLSASAQEAAVASQAGRRAGLADYLMSLSDRNNGGWWLLPNGDIVLTDNSVGWSHGIAARFTGWLRGTDRTLADQIDIPAAELTAIRRRLESARSRFAELGREDYLNETLERLSELQKRAIGRPAAAKKAPAKVARPETPRARALREGLSAADATAYAAYVRTHPGATIADWQEQRRQRQRLTAARRLSDESLAIGRAIAPELGYSTDADTIREVLARFNAAELLRIADAFNFTIPSTARTAAQRRDTIAFNVSQHNLRTRGHRPGVGPAPSGVAAMSPSPTAPTLARNEVELAQQPTDRASLIAVLDAKNPTALTLRRMAESVGLTIPTSLRNLGDITYWLAGQASHPGLTEAIAGLRTRTVFSGPDAVAGLVRDLPSGGGTGSEQEIAELVQRLGPYRRSELLSIARTLSVTVPPSVQSVQGPDRDEVLRRHIARSLAFRSPSTVRHRTLQLLGIETRALGEDTHPGGEQLHHYWTRGEGLAKWRTHPHPWTTLRDLLLKYVTRAKADRMASAWFREVFGYWSGDRKGQNPVGPG